jgi:hypothetical protein
MTTSAPTRKHAYKRPPSGAARWLSCPGSATVVPLYPNMGSDASEKGDVAHDHLETGIVFGVQPDTDDPDMDLNIRGVLDHVQETKDRLGPSCRVYAECTFEIPETGEIGTGDVTYVSDSTLGIGDYKNGYVPVGIYLNPQLMLYLCGAIHKHGTRKNYFIELYQPNYHHADGPYRKMVVTEEQLEWFRDEVRRAVSADDFRAGKHCKKTYCEHRGACQTLLTWAETEGNDAWHTWEINGSTDNALSTALDHAEILQGLRDELRKEAMRRIMHGNRSIAGYKIVKSRQDRAFAGEEAEKAVAELCFQLGADEHEVYDIVGGVRKMASVATIERFFKQRFKNMGQGAWSKAWNASVKPHLREFSGSLTLVRDIDGRPSHTRGSEFTAINPSPLGALTNII